MGLGLVQARLSSNSPTLQFRISEYAPLNMVGIEQPPSPKRQQEGMAECKAGGATSEGGHVDTHQPGRNLLPGLRAKAPQRWGEACAIRGDLAVVGV